MKTIEEWEKNIRGLYSLIFSDTNKLFFTKKLVEICDIIKGEQINNSELLSEGDYYVMNGGISPSGYHSDFNSEADTVSISEGGNSCGYVQYNSKKFWSGGHCYTLKNIDRSIDKKYLYR